MRKLNGRAKSMWAFLLVLVMLLSLAMPVFGAEAALPEEGEAVTAQGGAEEEATGARAFAQARGQGLPGVMGNPKTPVAADAPAGESLPFDIRQMSDEPLGRLYVLPRFYDDGGTMLFADFPTDRFSPWSVLVMDMSTEETWELEPGTQVLWDDRYELATMYIDGAFADIADGEYQIGLFFVDTATDEMEYFVGEFWMENGIMYDHVGLFVKRVYETCMRRQPDVEGVTYWGNSIWAGDHDAASLIEYFFMGPEFTSSGYNDNEFVDRAYEALLGRVPDDGGRAYWTLCLQQGNSRRGALRTLAGQPEFVDICDAHFVPVGEVPAVEARDYNVNLTRFVYRMYEEVLDRGAEVEGLNHWCGQMAYNGMQPYQLASNFVFSEEFIAQNHSDESFVTVMYRAFMGREPEANGYAYWVEQLGTGGKDRRGVFDGFATSREFVDIAAGFGL